MGISGGPNIIEDGLVLALDAADRNSLSSAPTVNLVLNPTLSGSNDTQTQAITSNWVFSGDSGPTGFRFYTGSIAGVTPLFPGEGMIGTTGPNAVPNNRRIYYTGGSQANTTYTLSFYYYMTGSLISGNLVSIFEYSGSTNVKSVSYPLTSASLNTWTRNVTTFTTGTGSTGITNWGPVMSFSSTTGLFMQRLQVEKSPYVNDFITGSRSLIWNDLSGNNNVSLLSASISSSIPRFNSPNENILNFDGTGSYANISTFVIPTSSFSCESFFQWADIGASRGSIFSLNYNFPTSGYLIRQRDDSSGKLVIWSDNGTETSIFSTTSLTANTWNHIVVVQSSGTCFIYINGVLDSSQALQNPVLNQLYPVLLGTRAVSGASAGAYLKGKIAVGKIYNRALSASEILQNYNAIKSRFNL
jgi:hypothetical protein